MKNFTPLLFLASLGAGGISIIPFAFLQYVHPHNKGLVTLQEILENTFSFPIWTYYLLSTIMIVFTILHIALTGVFSKQFIHFFKSVGARTLWNDPLKNSAYLAPFISLVMTMNVLIGPVRFFVPILSENLQQVMPYAFAFWFAIFLSLHPARRP